MRDPLGAQQDTGSCFVEAFKGHTDADQALWYEFESHLAAESSTGLLWKIYRQKKQTNKKTTGMFHL